MLGALRMPIQNAMKEIHTLGTKISAEIPETETSPDERLKLLKEGISEALERNQLPQDISLQDLRFSPARCKV
jgi:hypothetical protein